MIKQEYSNKYDFISEPVDWLRSVRVWEKWWFIDKNDKLIIDIIYKDVWEFYKGFCKVKEYGSSGWNIINKKGEQSSVKFYKILKVMKNFNDMRIVKNIKQDTLTERFWLINNDWSEIVPCVYIEIEEIWEYLKLKEEWKIPVLFNKEGVVFLEWLYSDYKEQLPNGKFIVKFDDLYWMVNKEWEIFIDFIFEKYIGKEGDKYNFILYKTLYSFNEKWELLEVKKISNNYKYV